MVAFLIGLALGAILGGFFVWMWMFLSIAGRAFDAAHGDGDFLSEPVELERRSISRWSMRIVK